MSASEPTIQISGKTVEEIGFQKIAAQLATLHELRIVLLDGLCVRGVLDRPCLSVQELVLQERQRIKDQTLKIQELDLSRNLIEEWADVVGICCVLRFLTTLKLEFVVQPRKSDECSILAVGTDFEICQCRGEKNGRTPFLASKS